MIWISLLVKLRYAKVSRCNSIDTSLQQTHYCLITNFVQTVFSTVNRARTDATNVRVHDMGFVETVYSTTGTSTLNLEGGSVYDNNPDNLWVAVDMEEGSTGNIMNTTFDNNVNIEYVFSVFLGSTLSLQSVQVTDTVGGQVLVSIFAIRSKVLLHTLQFAQKSSCTHCMLTHRSLIRRTVRVRVPLGLFPWIRESSGIVLKYRVSANSS